MNLKKSLEQILDESFHQEQKDKKNLNYILNKKYGRTKEVPLKEEKKQKALQNLSLLNGEQSQDFKEDYSKNKVNFQNGIPANAKVIVTRMSHLIEIQHMQKMNFESHITVLPKDENGKKRYAVNDTGEIFECKESENRGENNNSLGKTFKKMRYLINNNFYGHRNELHVILTVAPPGVTDTDILYVMFKNFIKRLKYKLKKKKGFENVNLEYINVIEPHASGKWHCHVLLRFDGIDQVRIENKEMAEIWGHGFVTVKGMYGVDNIGAYLSAYLSDIDVTDENINNENVITKTVEGKEKKFLKGGRLHFYDVGVNIFRSSKGIEFPTRENMKYADIKKEVGHIEPNYSQKIAIEIDEYKNEITYLQYNLKRK